MKIIFKTISGSTYEMERVMETDWYIRRAIASEFPTARATNEFRRFKFTHEPEVGKPYPINWGVTNGDGSLQYTITSVVTEVIHE